MTNRLRVTFALGALASAFVMLAYIWFGGPDWVHYTFKPLTIVFLMALVWVAPRGTSSRYRYAIFVGLGFSLGGDILLMLPQDLFVPGLLSFLVAHLFYIAAFAPASLHRLSLACAIPFVIYGIGLNVWLYQHVGAMRWPVWGYTLAILTMVYFALRRCMIVRHWGALLACVGSVLFVFSDSVIAACRFRISFSRSGMVIVSTYFAAQFLIALSTFCRDRDRSAA